MGFYENWIDNTINKNENRITAKLTSSNDHSNDNILINPPREQFDHNTLNAPTNGDLLSESSQLYETVIKKDKKYDLSTILNERSIKDQSELSISS